MGAPLNRIAPHVDAGHGIARTVCTLMDLDVTRVNIYNYGRMRRPALAAVGQSLAGGPDASKP